MQVGRAVNSVTPATVAGAVFVVPGRRSGTGQNLSSRSEIFSCETVDRDPCTASQERGRLGSGPRPPVTAPRPGTGPWAGRPVVGGRCSGAPVTPPRPPRSPQTRGCAPLYTVFAVFFAHFATGHGSRDGSRGSGRVAGHSGGRFSDIWCLVVRLLSVFVPGCGLWEGTVYSGHAGSGAAPGRP
jgi:hypothetical protein